MMPFDGLPFAGATYTLLGFTRHYGDETSHGHYLSYVKGSDGGWYELDDAKPIRAISDEKVTS